LKLRDSIYDTLNLQEHLKSEGHLRFRKYKASIIRKFLSHQSIILDVGCGSGFDLKNFMRQGFDVVGLDLSLNMLRQVREYLQRRDIDLVRGDALSLPFRDDVFSAVHSHELSTFNFGDVKMHVRVLKEQRRVCKDDGIIVITLPIKDYLGSEFRPTSEEEMKYLIRHAEMRPIAFIHLPVNTPDATDVLPTLLKIVKKILPTRIRALLHTVRQGYLKETSYWIIAVCRANEGYTGIEFMNHFHSSN